MATTWTSSMAQANIQPKYDAVGVQSVHVQYNLAAATLSDIVWLAKVPNGALITSVKGFIGTSNTDSVIKLGWYRASDKAGSGASETAFGTWTSTATLATTELDISAKFLGAVAISFTDSLGSDFAYIYATCSVGSFTDTFSFDLTVTYHMDHREGYGS